MSHRVILASGSPRRRELLKYIFKDFEVVPSNADEDITEADPACLVEKLSKMKASEVFERMQDEDDMVPPVTGMKRLSKMFSSSRYASTDNLLVIGADTIVVRDGRVLGKPKDEEDAFEILRSLQGRAHEVYTGVTILKAAGDDDQDVSDAAVDEENIGDVKAGRITFHEKTIVHIAEMSDKEIRDYIKTGDPMDKAGAYGIQNSFARFVSGIEGDYNNVVGLPVARLYAELNKAGMM